VSWQAHPVVRPGNLEDRSCDAAATLRRPCLSSRLRSSQRP
jgi:hypothetical protein